MLLNLAFKCKENENEGDFITSINSICICIYWASRVDLIFGICNIFCVFCCTKTFDKMQIEWKKIKHGRKLRKLDWNATHGARVWAHLPNNNGNNKLQST